MPDPLTSPVTLTLPNMGSLFVAPTIDPLSEHPSVQLGEPGIDTLLRRWKTDGNQPGTIRLVVPETEIGPTTEANANLALHRWCAAQRDRLAKERQLLVRVGKRSLRIGLIALAASFMLANLVGSTAFNFLPNVLQTTLSEGFVIIGWVVMWNPLDVLVFEPIAMRKRDEALAALQQSTVVVVAHPNAP